MSSVSEFTIPFEGLTYGKHTFTFEITDAFFEELEYSIIKGAEVRVNFVLNKKETMMIGDFEMEGYVTKPCDRCMDLMQIPVEISHQLYYKFGEEDSGDENLIVLPRSAFTLSISSTIYELLTVALPNRTVHAEGDCNEAMLDLIEKYEDSSYTTEDGEEEKTDPRWNKLKNLK